MMAHPVCFALIVAGGKGLRLDPAHPKQYLPLLGKPILIHTLERFYHSGLFQGAVVVLPAADLAAWPDLRRRYGLDIADNGTDGGFFEAVAGGATRFDSVGAGLQALNRRTETLCDSGAVGHPNEVWVAVHDAVRPLVSTHFLQHCLNAALVHGNAVPALSPVESFRYLTPSEDSAGTAPGTTGPANRPIDRNRLRSLQTPQCARLQRLTAAWHLAAARPASERTDRFTDEATVLEFAGDRIHLCDGSPFNLKITRPLDLAWAEHILKQSLI